MSFGPDKRNSSNKQPHPNTAMAAAFEKLFQSTSIPPAIEFMNFLRTDSRKLSNQGELTEAKKIAAKCSAEDAAFLIGELFTLAEDRKSDFGNLRIALSVLAPILAEKENSELGYKAFEILNTALPSKRHEESTIERYGMYRENYFTRLQGEFASRRGRPDRDEGQTLFREHLKNRGIFLLNVLQYLGAQETNASLRKSYADFLLDQHVISIPEVMSAKNQAFAALIEGLPGQDALALYVRAGRDTKANGLDTVLKILPQEIAAMPLPTIADSVYNDATIEVLSRLGLGAEEFEKFKVLFSGLSKYDQEKLAEARVKFTRDLSSLLINESAEVRTAAWEKLYEFAISLPSEAIIRALDSLRLRTSPESSPFYDVVSKAVYPEIVRPQIENFFKRLVENCDDSRTREICLSELLKTGLLFSTDLRADISKLLSKTNFGRNIVDENLQKEFESLEKRQAIDVSYVYEKTLKFPEHADAIASLSFRILAGRSVPEKSLIKLCVGLARLSPHLSEFTRTQIIGFFDSKKISPETILKEIPDKPEIGEIFSESRRVFSSQRQVRELQEMLEPYEAWEALEGKNTGNERVAKIRAEFEEKLKVLNADDLKLFSEQVVEGYKAGLLGNHGLYRQSSLMILAFSLINLSDQERVDLLQVFSEKYAQNQQYEIQEFLFTSIRELAKNLEDPKSIHSVWELSKNELENHEYSPIVSRSADILYTLSSKVGDNEREEVAKVAAVRCAQSYVESSAYRAIAGCWLGSKNPEKREALEKFYFDTLKLGAHQDHGRDVFSEAGAMQLLKILPALEPDQRLRSIEALLALTKDGIDQKYPPKSRVLTLVRIAPFLEEKESFDQLQLAIIMACRDTFSLPAELGQTLASIYERLGDTVKKDILEFIYTKLSYQGDREATVPPSQLSNVMYGLLFYAKDLRPEAEIRLKLISGGWPSQRSPVDFMLRALEELRSQKKPSDIIRNLFG